MNGRTEHADDGHRQASDRYTSRDAEEQCLLGG
jgi:hypothetical protein